MLGMTAVMVALALALLMTIILWRRSESEASKNYNLLKEKRTKECDDLKKKIVTIRHHLLRRLPLVPNGAGALECVALIDCVIVAAEVELREIADEALDEVLKQKNIAEEALTKWDKLRCRCEELECELQGIAGKQRIKHLAVLEALGDLEPVPVTRHRATNEGDMVGAGEKLLDSIKLPGDQ